MFLNAKKSLLIIYRGKGKNRVYPVFLKATSNHRTKVTVP